MYATRLGEHAHSAPAVLSGIVNNSLHHNAVSTQQVALLESIEMRIHPSHIDLRTNVLYGNGIFLLAIAFSISGCIVINNFFKHIPKIPILHYIGKESMVFYVTHMLILELLPLKHWNISGEIAFAIMCISCLILPPLIKKSFPRLF